MKYDICIVGGGMSGTMAGVEMLRRGRTVCIISAGRSLNPTSREEFRHSGGEVIDNSRAVAAEFDGDAVRAVMTDNGIRVEASTFVLASGRFFSKGLVSDMTGIREPVFGSDVEYAADPSEWSDEDFYAPQPFESFGVRTQDGRILRGGRPAENLFACGEILCGGVDVNKSVEQVCRNIR